MGALYSKIFILNCLCLQFSLFVGWLLMKSAFMCFIEYHKNVFQNRWKREKEKKWEWGFITETLYTCVWAMWSGRGVRYDGMFPNVFIWNSVHFSGWFLSSEWCVWRRLETGWLWNAPHCHCRCLSQNSFLFFVWCHDNISPPATVTMACC